MRPLAYLGEEGALRLLPEEVQLWSLDLAAAGEAAPDLWALLSDDEKERAECYAFDRDRARFVTGRGALRRLVSRYTQVAPHEVRFVYGSLGKPALSHSSLCFNVSHSGDLALFAFAWRRQIGVDVEQVGRLEHFEEIARHQFAPAEYRELVSLPQAVRRRAFFNAWTRKEAYLKATGEGLSLPLGSFQVSMAPGRPAGLIQHRDPRELLRWRFAEPALPEGYAGTLVVER